MKHESFTISEAVKFGWKTTTENFWFFVKILAILFVIQMVFNAITANMPQDQGALIFIASLVSTLVQIIVQLGAIAIALKLVDGKKPEVKDLFSQVKLLGRYIGASIIGGILVLLGLIVFIIPGIIVAIAIQFFSYLMVDKNAGIIESLKRSAEITKGVRLKLLGLMIVSGLITILGMLVFFIGLLWAIPTVMMAMAYVYRRLEQSGVEGGLVVADDDGAEPVPTAAPAPAPATLETSKPVKEDAKPASDLPPNVPPGTKTDPEPAA